MNSDDAAAVRDAIAGCPGIVDPGDVSERSDRRDPHTTTRCGNEVTIAGDRVELGDSRFFPPRVEQVGTISQGDAERPVFAVVLQAIGVEDDGVRSLHPNVVYEVAKHECRIRFYPPDHRLDGDVWICDHFGRDIYDDNGERCECGSTYFKIREGTPVCARCGEASTDTRQATLASDVKQEAQRR